MTLAKAKTDPTERSIPPVIITMLSPIAMMAINENCLITETKLSDDKNTLPTAMVSIRHMAKRIITIPKEVEFLTLAMMVCVDPDLPILSPVIN
jgi:hypothetical protein